MKTVSEVVCPCCKSNPANFVPSPLSDPLITPCDDCFRKTEDQWKRRSQGSARVDVSTLREHFLRRVPKEYQESDVSRFPEKWIDVERFLPERGRGLILMGETGKCKTRMGVQLVLGLATRFQAQGDFVSAQEFAEHSQNRYAAEKGAYHQRRLQEIRSSRFLLLDDVGKQANSRTVEAALFDLIERRTTRHLTTIVTTNSTGRDLEAMLSEDRGPAMIRRLREFNDVIVVK